MRLSDLCIVNRSRNVLSHSLSLLLYLYLGFPSLSHWEIKREGRLFIFLYFFVWRVIEAFKPLLIIQRVVREFGLIFMTSPGRWRKV